MQKLLSGNPTRWPNDVNSKAKYCLAALALILSQGVAPLLAEPTPAAELSSEIRRAILDGLPAYDGRIYRAPLEQPHPIELSQPAFDPDVVVLPALTIADSRGTKNLNRADIMVNPDSNPLVAGTGVSEFSFRKYRVTVPTILFIPIGLKFSW